MKLGIMRFLLLLACFGAAQTYFSAKNSYSLAHSLQGMFSKFCSATYAILISYAVGLQYFSHPSGVLGGYYQEALMCLTRMAPPKYRVRFICVSKHVTLGVTQEGIEGYVPVKAC